MQIHAYSSLGLYAYARMTLLPSADPYVHSLPAESKLNVQIQMF